MTSLSDLLASYRQIAQTQREKGTYFEKLILCYLKTEPKYRDLYQDAWMYEDWAHHQGRTGQDSGIDLVAQTRGTGEFHAIQCKLYAEDYKLQKGDIDSFLAVSGKTIFTHRLVFSTCLHWSHHAEDAIQDQAIPVSRVDLYDLENSQIDWSQYQPNHAPVHMLRFAVEAGNLLEFFGFLIGIHHRLEHAGNLLGTDFVGFGSLLDFDHLAEGGLRRSPPIRTPF